MLKYKTRKMKSPQGLPRVFFCCHKEDFSLYFDTISDEILSYANCAVWYCDDATKVYDDEFMYDLSQMQLFVMPVTRRLLTEDNDALDVEFEFARENNIPVLPLMQETQLEELFNDRCGGIQYLDKSNMDITAISYTDKLKKFLDSVLIGDELAEKIRAAFDAYVFLSYRKKDRKYAQELMRLIHQNDFCRDIAVWYDEFLVPGEDFNGAIEAALKKSQLFVMTVTPNLINEINYVMTTEYPMAQEEGKPILPAMVVPTDVAQLQKAYKDIPKCVNARYKVELSEALLDAVKKMAIRENDKCPQHNFFIGLAYLGGVDVEVDHERALRLIRTAAENGLKEAVEKLISMYTYEEGVKFDIKELARWRNRLVLMLRKEYESAPDIDKLEDYLRAYFELCDACFLTANYDLAERYLSEMMCDCEKLLGELEDDSEWLLTYRFLGLANLHYGHMSYDTGRFDESQYHLEKSIKISQEVIESRDLDWFIRDNAIGYRILSQLHLIRNEQKEAAECLHKCTALLENVVKRTDDPQFKLDIAVNYTDISRLSRLMGDSEKSVDYAKKAILATEELMEEHDRKPFFFFYINCFVFLAESYRLWNKFDLALPVYFRALELINEYNELIDANNYHLLAMCKSRIAHIYFAQNKYDVFYEYAIDAMHIYEENLSGKVNILTSCDDSQMNLYMLFYYYHNSRNETRNAKLYLRKAFDSAQELLKLEVKACVPDVLRVYAFYIENLNIEYGVEKAQAMFDEAIALIKANNLDIDNYMTSTSVYLLYLVMCQVYATVEGGDQKLREYCTKALDIREKIEKQAPQLLSIVPLSTPLHYIGYSYMETDRKLAKKYFMQAESAALENLSAYPTLDEYNVLCMIYYNLSVCDTFLLSKRWERKFFDTIDIMRDTYPNDYMYTTAYNILREAGYAE